MGRITDVEDLPTNEVTSDARVNIRASHINFIENARGQERRLNPPSIRRRLFFDDASDANPHAGTSRRSSGNFIQNDDKTSTKWNFDFENETPLPGDWLWVKVGPNLSEVEVAAKSEDNGSTMSH